MRQGNVEWAGIWRAGAAESEKSQRRELMGLIEYSYSSVEEIASITGSNYCVASTNS